MTIQSFMDWNLQVIIHLANFPLEVTDIYWYKTDII